METKKILIIEKRPMMREAMSLLLKTRLENYEIHTHDKLDSAILKATVPTMVLYSINEVEDATAPIVNNSKVPIVILYRDFKHAVLAKQIQHLESSMISHEAPVEDLLQCIDSTTLRRSFYCNITLQNTLDQLSNRRKSTIYDSKNLTMNSIRPHLLYSKLSNRQQEIIQLIFQGKSTSQIGSLLNLKLSTISTMKSQILKKMQVANVIELVKIYSTVPE